MHAHYRRYVSLVVLLVLVSAPPLLGALGVESFPWQLFLELPPRTHYMHHAELLWPVVYGVAAVALASMIWCGWMCAPWVGSNRAGRGKFPWWVWLGALALGIGWATAWSRAAWMAVVHPFSFVLIWIGYILLVEALLVRFGGRSSYALWGKSYLRLYPLSAMFWWTFELLNRFVQNWSYPALERFSASAYVGLASLAFSTVLPAVLATQRLLALFTSPSALAPVPLGRRQAAILLLVNCITLACVPIYPNQLFALVWLSPLVTAFCLAELFELRGLLSRRDPRAAARWALAALICGFFWELWNVHSAFKWLYHIPYVQIWHLFEMPLLGFAGYLPFGVLCGLVIEWSSSDASER